ncbi:hypothetical protein [Aliiglaciecola litoralis]|uniref:Uncharacterized protein n=1 Tax=Aliiglaciecola litoralis TaxID=582857 RepID=A0ABN1LQL8_9ALTE
MTPLFNEQKETRMLSFYSRIYQSLCLLSMVFCIYQLANGEIRQAVGALIGTLLILWFCLNPDMHRVSKWQNFEFKNTRYNGLLIFSIAALVAFNLYL